MYNLDGKVAVVTGSSSGIGRATAIRLAKEGCKVVINYVEDEKGAKETQRLCGKHSIIVKSDVSKVSECKKLVDEAVKKFGAMDILVNNAGVVLPMELKEVTEENYDKIMDTNVKGLFFLSKYASEKMKKGSAIVNISSIRAKKIRKTVTVYSASKAAVVNLTKGLSMELADKGIRVNSVAPGWIDTPMNANLSPEVMKHVIDITPMRRMGKPEEVANAVVFLASDESSYVTGATLFVDGGVTSG